MGYSGTLVQTVNVFSVSFLWGTCTPIFDAAPTLTLLHLPFEPRHDQEVTRG
jgi:hypothetical protein